MNLTNEQWRGDGTGNCSICRRREYCSKPCTRFSRNFQRTMRQIVKHEMDKVTGGAISAMDLCLGDKKYGRKKE